MGDVGEVSSNGGVLVEEDPLVFGPVSFSGSGWRRPDPASLSDECLVAAEEAAEQVLNCIHPTLDSEEKRRDVIDYVQRLIKRHLDCEAFPYGSVPLKTYLPDGDIDLTALKSLNVEESLARDVLVILQGEQLNENAEYEVKDAQFIDAEVKLVKCLVQNIVVDISFNQLGGLSTLCFLEQVDRLVGKNHLFKRSIILVKAWCYYESRILGAHHGLISTYALETLVLYIFHLFYSSLNGPLAVLYRFLDYFSQFDWESYCISLKGPVCISSLPDIVVKMPENGWKDLMLSEEFLENCIEMFSGSSRSPETITKAFQPKHLNIIDPLKENNNLGRSVHRGNFYRIRSAFKYGARKLGQVLLQPRDKVADEIHEFFSNTFARHRQKHASVIGHSALAFEYEESLTISLESSAELYSEDGMSDFENDSLGAEDRCTLEFKNELERCSMRDTSEMASETCSSADGLAVSGHRLAGDAYDLATSNSTLRIEHNTSDCTSSSNNSASLLGKHDHKSHYFSSKSSVENGSLASGNFHQGDLSNNARQKFGLALWLESKENHAEMNNTYRWCMDNSEVIHTAGSASSSPKASNFENVSLGCGEIDLFSIAGESDAPLNPLADLRGDYDCSIRNLLYANPPPSPSRIQIKKPWDTVRQSMPLSRSQFSQMNSNTLFAEPLMGHGIDTALLTAAFGSEGRQRTRGTGTYFPIMNGFSRDKPSHWRGRNKPLGSRNQFQRQNHSNGNVLSPASCKSNSIENSTRDFLPARSRFQGRGKSDVWCQSPRSVKDDNHTNGYENASFRIEFGSLGNLAEEVISGLSFASWDSTLGVSMEGRDSTSATKQERVTEQSLHLKNEDEFPPLCQ
ncbi:PAP/OAS1 substrate-binding domain superfamily [Abeliophyllum distichum]|uniref:PAP/OAS1 substrate-binding domain superfamily n=1 Tax=Abeliophyllum distichum TaxID=126358 RepID=A0ABD1Q3Y8_9LAMI